ncbi:MAG: hypothetical protein QOF14_5339 [Hyphomicrobiales bacterium]|nr:hypothetical protein [Hyphomicrobiales bacterium]
MDNSQQQTPNGPIDGAYETLGDIFYSSGRRGVHIYGVPPERMVVATVLMLLFGFPLTIVIAMAPFWDDVGDLAAIKLLNAHIAPAVDSLSRDYHTGWMPRFPLKRFFVASVSLVELIVLGNFIALFSRRVRKHALLVWICYDRKKVLQYFALSSVVFCTLWAFLFFDWKILSFLNSDYLIRIAVRIDACLVMTMPFAAALFGHMAAIVGLGALRAAAQTVKKYVPPATKLRRYRTIP